MGWKQGMVALKRGPLSGPEHALGRPDDLRQAAGDLEIANCVRRKPPEIVEFVVQDRFAGAPACRERHDQIVPAACGSWHYLAPAGEAHDIDLERGFLVDLAMQRRVQRFAEFNPSA